MIKRSKTIHQLLGYYSCTLGSPGFFDYIGTYRQTQKSELKIWAATYLSDDRAKQMLARDEQKFQLTKQYLATLKMGDFQQLQMGLQFGNVAYSDSLQEIREFFDLFFPPVKFKDVFINKSPFEFAVSTPLSDIDIDA